MNPSTKQLDDFQFLEITLESKIYIIPPILLQAKIFPNPTNSLCEIRGNTEKN